jgi:hypothetical protein
MKVATPYTKEKLEKCLQIMAEMSDDQDFPRNFDYCITLMTDIANSFYFKRSFEGKRNLTLDQEMLLYHPEQSADGVEWADKGKLAIPVRMVPMILIYFQWANVDGLTQLFGKEESKWFEKIREAMEPMVPDAPKNQVNGSPKMEDAILFARACLPDSHPGFDPNAKVNYENAVDILCYTEPTTMSQLNRYWVYEDVREYTLPYEKRMYHTDRMDLSKNGWAKWLSEQFDVIAGGYKYNDSLSLIIQIQMIGGKNSEIYRIETETPENTSHSWRTHTTIVQVLDGFYDPRDKEALPKLLKWQDENDKQAKEGGLFCDKDRRYLWGSYHRPDDDNQGASLDSVWDKYFDSKEKYDRLVDI